jgi:hypothetical protein
MTDTVALNGARYVIDLDARRAQRAEAGAEPTQVTLGGETFLFPPVQDWSVELVDKLSRGELVPSLRLLLEVTAYQRFMAQHPTVGDINELFDALGRHAGIGPLGNSSGSASS